MAPERKLSDEDVARLRDLADEGWALRDSAEVFGVSQQMWGGWCAANSVR